ncbi:MAG: InlB B-repeat-containing protein [Clostridia bacterium]|nr:InlB B-repeat-containing protein [Clostridia bacterium]
MKRYIKKLTVLLCFIFVFHLVCGYNYTYPGAGCSDKLKFSVCGDFVIDQNNKVHDLTDEAILKEEIYIPTTINGSNFDVYSVKNGGLWGSGRTVYARFREGNVKRIYMFSQENSGLSQSEFNSAFFNLSQATAHFKGYTIDYKYDLYDFVFEYYVTKRATKNIALIFNNNVSALWSNCIVDTYSAMQTAFDDENGRIEAGSISDRVTISCNLANIQYMYNYQLSPNNGHYFLDSVNSGEKINLIPQNPTREGYVFGGWYADSACTVPFDFDADVERKTLMGWYSSDFTGTKLKSAKLYYPKDYVTYIYAKWI